MYSRTLRASFVRQDRVAGKGVVATPRSGGGNVGTRGHDAGRLTLPI